jgi:hypothetical protein
MEMTMKFVSAFALVGALLVAGCDTVTPTPGTVSVGSVTPTPPIATRSVTNVSSATLTERQINPQRPRDCPRYVVDPDDPCY